MDGEKDLFPEITNPKKRSFLTAYVSCASLVRAAKIVGCTNRIHYHWKANDPEYEKAFEKAQKLAGDYLEDLMFGRAKQKSDVLLIVAMKGLKPERYADRQRVDFTGRLDSTTTHDIGPDVTRLLEKLGGVATEATAVDKLGAGGHTIDPSRHLGDVARPGGPRLGQDEDGS